MGSSGKPLALQLFFALLCYRETAAVDLNASTPCNASLDISVAFNGRVTLTLMTDRRQSAHEFWLFDFESHADAYFLVGSYIRSDRTGSCSNALVNLYWNDAFDDDFDPVSNSGLLNSFTPGSWFVENGETIRRDTLSFEGPIDTLLECTRSGAGMPHVFGSEAREEEIVLKATAYATCIRPRVFADASQGVYTIETAFPVTIRVSRSLSVVDVKAEDGNAAVSAAYYSAAFVNPVPVETSGAFFSGSEYTTLVLDFFTIARDTSSSSQKVYKMLNTTSAMTSVQSSELRLVSPADEASTADGKCYLENTENKCRQQFHFSYLLNTVGSLEKALNSQREADKRIDGVFIVSCDAVECPGDVVSSSCTSLDKMGQVRIGVEMSLGFTAALSHDDPKPFMMVYGLREQTDRVDARSKLVSQGQMLILMSQIGPAEIRDDYNATLRKLTICKDLEQIGCDKIPATDKLTYYDSSVAQSDISLGYIDSYSIYEVYFPMRGLVKDDSDHTIEAKYVINRVDGTGAPVEFVLNQRVTFVGCPSQSEYDSDMKLCVCNHGYILSTDTTTCSRDPSVTPEATTRAGTPSSAPRPVTKHARNGSVSFVVYLAMTFLMLIASICI